MDDNEYYNQLESEEDRASFREHLRHVAHTNRKNPTRYPCPTCGTPAAISAYEKSKGYHCAACTRAAEQGF